MIEVLLYTLIGYPIFYVVYTNVFGIVFTKTKWLYLVTIGGTCLLQCGVFCATKGDEWKDFVIIGCGFVSVFVLSEGKRWKNFLLFPIVYFLPCLVNLIGSYGIAAALNITHEMLCESAGLLMIAQMPAIIVFSVYGFVARKKAVGFLDFSPGQYFVLLLGICCAFLIIGFAQGLLAGDPLVYQVKDKVVFASIIMAFLFIVLSIWQQITWTKVQQYNMFLAGQKEHIQRLIEEDEARRRLAHDMRAHIQALNMLTQKEDMEQLKKYLEEMEEGLNRVKVERYTSIPAVDAIISEWHNKALDSQSEWSFKGEIAKIEHLSVFELCTLFSNLLSNAVEAVERVVGEKRIDVNISVFQGKLVLDIGNSCDAVQSSKSRPRTNKKDSINHGLGLKNVEEVVHKHKGLLEYETEPGWFQISIVI